VVIRAPSRLQSFGFWDISTFLINGSLWVFVGVQIPDALRGIYGVDGGLRRAVFLALAVTGVVVVTRVAWVEVTTLLGRVVDRGLRRPNPAVGFRQRCVTSWAGFRGAVSLAAAIAVPEHTGPLNRTPFPDRSLLIFVVVVVILVTVIVQGTTLPAVVRWARMPDDVAHADELQLARCDAAQAALEALPTLADEFGLSSILRNRLQKEYEEHAALVKASGGDDSGIPNLSEKIERVRQVRLGVIEHQRRAVTALRNQNRIDDIVLRELQATLDLAEVQLLSERG
jgi:Na+/H+ antiporter